MVAARCAARDHDRLGIVPGEGWVSDIVKELKLKDVTKLHAGYGEIPDLSKVDPASDVVFT